MRVHPDFFTPKPGPWRFRAYLTILLGMLAFVIIRGPHQIVSAVQISTSPSEQKVEVGIDTLMQTIERSTVAVPVNFETLAPPRGARIALTLNNPQGESMILVDEAWVSKSVGREVVLRLHPQQALILQSARSYGAFNFIEIPAVGPSPYSGKAVADSEQLTSLMDVKEPHTQVPRAARKQKGYAWIPGESRGFGIEDSGTIKPLGNQ